MKNDSEAIYLKKIRMGNYSGKYDPKIRMKFLPPPLAPPPIAAPGAPLAPLSEGAWGPRAGGACPPRGERGRNGDHAPSEVPYSNDVSYGGMSFE